MAERPEAGSNTVRCDACFAVFRGVKWTEESRCPRCRSAKVTVLPKVTDAVEYVLADRSKGYALEDIRFAKLAQWSRFISGQQYQEAFKRQKAYVGGNKPVPPIDEVMRRARFMKKAEVAAILDYRSRERPDKDDSEFAKLALQSGFVEKDHLAECIDAQHEAKRMQRDVPPLPCLLYERRHLQENQIQAIIQKQAEGGTGPIRFIQDYQDERAVKPVEQLLGQKGSAKRRLRMPVLVVIALCLLWVAVSRMTSGSKLMVKTMCVNPSCESAISAAPRGSDWPARCQSCPQHARTVYPVSICERCGHEYVNEKPSEMSPRCPRCGSSRVIKYIDKTVDTRKIKEQVKQGDPES